MEKPFIELDSDSWHYKLTHFVLQDACPTPDNMSNFCPYFWLFVFSLLTCPFVGLFRLVQWTLETMLKPLVLFADKLIIEPNAKKWKEELTAEQVAAIFEHNTGYYSRRSVYEIDAFYGTTTFRKPYIPKKYKGQELEIVNEYLAKNGIKGDEKVGKWFAKMEQTARVNRYNSLVAHVSLKDRIETFTDEVKESVSSYKSIIKWTKRVVGAIITAVGLFITYFIVSFLGKGILYVVINWSWTAAGAVGIIIGGMAVVVALLWFLNIWGEYISRRYKNGEKLWYVQALYYIFALPIKAVFYHFLFKFVVMTILWGSCVIVYQVGKSFLGIFGEYFSASYGDYCPGIKWKEKNSK